MFSVVVPVTGGGVGEVCQQPLALSRLVPVVGYGAASQHSHLMSEIIFFAVTLLDFFLVCLVESQMYGRAWVEELLVESFSIT